MKSVLATIVALTGIQAFASNQSLTCYGRNQQANLQLEFVGEELSYSSVTIHDEGRVYEAKLPKRKVNHAKGTVTYSQTRGPIKVTIPLAWEDHGFERFSSSDPRRGSQIAEQTKFQFARGRSLEIRECESDVD